MKSLDDDEAYLELLDWALDPYEWPEPSEEEIQWLIEHREQLEQEVKAARRDPNDCIYSLQEPICHKLYSQVETVENVMNTTSVFDLLQRKMPG